MNSSTLKPFFSAFRILKIYQFRVGVIGITNSKPYWNKSISANLKLKTLKPSVALADVLSRIRGKVDLIILLAYMPKQEIMKILDEFEEIDIALASYGNYSTTRIQKRLGSYYAFVGDRGQNIGVFRFNLRSGTISDPDYSLVNMSVDFSEDHTVKEMIDYVVDGAGKNQ